MDKEQFNDAYIVLFMADSVLCLFRKFSSFGPKEVKVIKGEDGNTYMLFGKNRVRLTKRFLRELEKHRTFAFYVTPEGKYDPDSFPIMFEMEDSGMYTVQKVFNNEIQENTNKSKDKNENKKEV